MSKKTNKTSVADALKVIADALTAGETVVKTEEKKEPRTFYAVYAWTTYHPMDFNGRYISNPAKQAEYYKLYPDTKPANQFSPKMAGAAKWQVEVTKDNKETAQKAAQEALSGLKVLAEPNTARGSGYSLDYHLVTITEGIAE